MAVDVGGKVTVDREDVEVAVDVDGKLTVDDKDYLIVRQVNHSEVWDRQQTLTHVYWTKSCNQGSLLVTTLAVKTKGDYTICLS